MRHMSGLCIKNGVVCLSNYRKAQRKWANVWQLKMIKAYKILCKYEVLERGLIIILVQWMGPTISILSGYFNWQIEASL